MTSSSPDIMGLLEETLARSDVEVEQKQPRGSPDTLRSKIQAEESTKAADIHQKMTQITRDKIEKDGLKQKAPVVQEVPKVPKKRLISKQVEDRTAEKCDVIEKRWEQQRVVLLKILELYEVKAMECEKGIKEVISELAEFDNLIRECEDKIRDSSSEVAEKNHLIKQRQDSIEELKNDFDKRQEELGWREEGVQDLRDDISIMNDQIEELKEGIEECGEIIEGNEEDTKDLKDDKSGRHDKIKELEEKIEECEYIVEANEEDIDDLNRKIFKLINLESEHKDCIKVLNSELAKLDCLIKECEAKLERYKDGKSMQEEHKKGLQQEKESFEQKQKGIGDIITNRELEIGEEIREAYRLAKEEVERLAN